MEKRFGISDKYITILSCIVLFIGLYVSSLYSYILFHSIVELFSIAVAWGVFMLAWNSRRYFENNYVLFISISFLFVGLLDLLHTLSYKGMNLFQGYDANLPTQLWIASRYLQGISFFAAPFFLNRRIRLNAVFTAYAIICYILIASIFYWKIFPDCYVEGVGLTLFKKISEYVISIIFMFSIIFLVRSKREFDKEVLRLLVLSIGMGIFAELSFTTYVSVYGLSNLTGHFFKIISFYLLYKAIIETGLAKPYDLLFRNLKQSEEAFRQSEERYRCLVELSPETIAVHGEGRYIYVNPAGVKLFGAGSPEELIGRTVLELVHPEFREIVNERIRKGYIDRVKTPPRELKIIRLDGTAVDVEAAAAPVVYMGKPATQVILRDITSRKQTEQFMQKTLEESRQRQAEVSALLKASRAVLEYREFKDTAKSIFDSCKNLIDAAAGYVALSSADGRENELVYLDSGGLSCSVDPSSPMPIRGLRGQAYLTGKTVYDNNFSNSEHMKFMPEGHSMLNNVLFAPLMLEGRVMGLLGLANKTGGFTEDDVRIASAFGELAAIALYNSRLLESLKRSEEHFRSVVETACDAVISVDSRGDVILWNKAAETIFGYTSEEVIGKSLAHVMPERFRESHNNAMQRMVSTFESQMSGKTMALSGLKKDGKEFPIELSLANWKTSEGIFFTGIIRDITERKEAEKEISGANEKLRAQKKELEIVMQELKKHRDYLDLLVKERTSELQRTNEELEHEIAERTNVEEALRESASEFKRLSQEFHTLLDAIPDSIILLSDELKILWANKGTAKILKKDVSELTGKSCYEVWHKLSSPCEECPAVRSFRTGMGEVSQSVRNDKFFDIRAFPIRNENNRVENVIVVTSDVTEKMRLQAETIRSGHLAALGELAAGVAHEINNPINGIINYAQILVDMGRKAGTDNDIANQIIEEGTRIANIVKSLLSFARDRKEEKGAVRIYDILLDSFALTETQLRKDGIELKIIIPEDLPEIIAHPQQIQQVLLNIINNARYALNMKHPNKHKEKILEIKGEKTTINNIPYVRITFYDQGIGISPDMLDKVMNPFFTTKPAGKGTGLGLSISHGIISDHSGKLYMQSVEGEFTRVIVEIPAANDAR